MKTPITMRMTATERRGLPSESVPWGVWVSISEAHRQPDRTEKRNPTNGSTAGWDFASLRLCWSS